MRQGTDEEERCPTCGGTGFVSDDDDGDGRESVLNTSTRLTARVDGAQAPNALTVAKFRRVATLRPVASRRTRLKLKFTSDGARLSNLGNRKTDLTGSARTKACTLKTAAAGMSLLGLSGEGIDKPH